MKLPEMPGRIIVQIAIAPQIAMNQGASGVVEGDRRQIAAPIAAPMASQRTSTAFLPLRSASMNTAETRISPKKNAQVCTGWWLRTYSISFASENTLATTPAPSQSRNVP